MTIGAFIDESQFTQIPVIEKKKMILVVFHPDNGLFDTDGLHLSRNVLKDLQSLFSDTAGIDDYLLGELDDPSRPGFVMI